MKNTKDLTVLSILVSIIVLMSIMPFLGYINLGIFNATLLFIPVAIGIGVQKKLSTAIVLGLAFGISSWINALTTIDAIGLNALFRNPLVSVLPRLIMAVGSLYIFKLLEKIIKKNPVRYFILGFSTAFLNTIFVFLMLILIYNNNGLGGEVVLNLKWVLGIIASVSIIEWISSTILSGIIGKTLDIALNGE